MKTFTKSMSGDVPGRGVLDIFTNVKAENASLALPLAPESRSWDASGARKRLAKYSSSDKSGSKDKMNWVSYSRYFLYTDSKNKENFSGYKFPFADIVNGTPHAIWKGITAARAALHGSRTGVKPDVSSSGSSRAETILNNYYKKFDKTLPGSKKSFLEVMRAKQAEVAETGVMEWVRTVVDVAYDLSYIVQDADKDEISTDEEKGELLAQLIDVLKDVQAGLPTDAGVYKELISVIEDCYKVPILPDTDKERLWKDLNKVLNIARRNFPQYKQKAAGYDCECIDCGHKMKSLEHCRDIKCPECGGTMRRKDRPGTGRG